MNDSTALVKLEAIVLRERVEIVINAVEEQSGHVGVTVIEAVGHGRQRGIKHEYRGRTFESRFLPKSMLVFVIERSKLDVAQKAIADAARSGHESGDGISWVTALEGAWHHRTDSPLATGGSL